MEPSYMIFLVSGQACPGRAHLKRRALQARWEG